MNIKWDLDSFGIWRGHTKKLDGMYSIDVRVVSFDAYYGCKHLGKFDKLSQAKKRCQKHAEDLLSIKSCVKENKMNEKDQFTKMLLDAGFKYNANYNSVEKNHIFTTLDSNADMEFTINNAKCMIVAADAIGKITRK